MLENVIEDRLHIRQARSINFGYFEANALGDSICDVDQIDRIETKVVVEKLAQLLRRIGQLD